MAKQLISYAFTVKVNHFYPGVTDYEQWLEKARSKGFYIDFYTYELDEADKLHMHGVARARSKYYVNGIRPYGWHFQIVPINTIDGMKTWTRYCFKNDKGNENDNEEVLWKYEIRQLGYPFRD